MRVAAVTLGSVFSVVVLAACAAPDARDGELVSAAALNEPAEHHHPHAPADGGSTTDASVAAPALPAALGPSDALAQSACALSTTGAIHKILVSRPEDAATVVVVPSATRLYHFHKPAPGAVGYAKIQTADWHTTVAFGAPAGVSMTVASGQPTLATSRNGACSETLTDTRFIIHEWGSYLLTFAADGPDEFYLSVLAQN